MNNQALKLTLKENKIPLIFSAVFATGIALSGIGLFGKLGKISFASGVTSMVLLIPLSLLAIFPIAASIQNMREKGIDRYSVQLMFLGIAAIGGTILTGVSLFSELDSSAKFITGVVGSALLMSSLLYFVAITGRKMKDEYNEANRCVGSIVDNVDSRSGVNSDKHTSSNSL